MPRWFKIGVLIVVPVLLLWFVFFLNFYILRYSRLTYNGFSSFSVFSTWIWRPYQRFFARPLAFIFPQYANILYLPYWDRVYLCRDRNFEGLYEYCAPGTITMFDTSQEDPELELTINHVFPVRLKFENFSNFNNRDVLGNSVTIFAYWKTDIPPDTYLSGKYATLRQEKVPVITKVYVELY